VREQYFIEPGFFYFYFYKIFLKKSKQYCTLRRLICLPKIYTESLENAMSTRNKNRCNSFMYILHITARSKVHLYCIKGIDRSFELRGEIRLIGSVITNWRLGNFFLSHFKWPSSQDQQKTNSCRLITFKVTLTGQSQFMLIF
jgi:hypothetical protein